MQLLQEFKLISILFYLRMVFLIVFQIVLLYIIDGKIDGFSESLQTELEMADSNMS